MRRQAVPLVCALLAALAPQAAAAVEDTVVVEVNRAKVVRLGQPAATVILGNPAVADALVQNSNMLVVTGKSYGTTNLIVLDPAGETLDEYTLHVTGGSDGIVTIQKGPARLSYSCNPVCERTLAIGDSSEPYTELDAQIQTSLGLAQGQAGSGN